MKNEIFLGYSFDIIKLVSATFVKKVQRILEYLSSSKLYQQLCNLFVYVMESYLLRKYIIKS